MQIFQAAVVLEGDFTVWAIYDSFDETSTAGTALATAFAVFNRIESLAILSDINGPPKTYTISTKTLSAAHAAAGVEFTYITSKFSASAYGTYFVAYSDAHLYIYKNGVIIDDFTDTALGLNDIISATISPCGRYVAVSGQRTLTTTDGWVILVGS